MTNIGLSLRGLGVAAEGIEEVVVEVEGVEEVVDVVDEVGLTRCQDSTAVRLRGTAGVGAEWQRGPGRTKRPGRAKQPDPSIRVVAWACQAGLGVPNKASSATRAK